METVTYDLSPYGDCFPRGTLAVTQLEGPTDDGRMQWACAIAWSEDRSTRKVVYDEVVRGPVATWGTEVDRVAETAIRFATYNPRRDPDGPYVCHPVKEWREWVESYGEDVGTLLDRTGSAALLRNP